MSVDPIEIKYMAINKHAYEIWQTRIWLRLHACKSLMEDSNVTFYVMYSNLTFNN